MKLYKLLTLSLILSSNIALGHQDFWTIKDFNNVKVRVKTGYHYEEIEKAWIIGELANRLCKQLHYTQPVFIDFNHHYTHNCEPDYFLSFDNGTITQAWDTEKPKPFLKEVSLIVREVSHQFNPATTLKLLEYAIANVKKINTTQSSITYDQNYCDWKIKTIDTLLVKKIALSSTSTTVNKVLFDKVYRFEYEKTDISYYFQNNQYHVFYRDYKGKDTVLLTIDNVYQFQSIDFNKLVVFDTDSSFYFVQGVNNMHASKRKIIEDIHDNWKPFEISMIGSYKIALSFWDYDQERVWPQRERNVLYKSDTDELIQDLDKKLSGK